MTVAAASVHELAPRRRGGLRSALPALKFDPPRPRPGHLRRARQLARIDPQARLLLVCAPAGYGKTTLVGQWVRRDPERAVAWIQLTDGDDSPAAFWAALTGAIAAICPAVGRRSLAELLRAEPDIHAAVLVPLVEELRAGHAELDLVLDDLQCVADGDVHAQLGWFVENAPATLRVAIATSQPPALPLGRLGALGELTELRGADLRFGAGEAGRLLNEVFELRLGEDDVNDLTRRTGGRPADLYLAGLALHRARDRAGAVAALVDGDAMGPAQLAEALLRGLGAPTRRFLRRSSILDSFCAPLCDAVAGAAAPAEQVLAELRGQRHILEPLDRRARWHAYAAPFGQLLRAELQATEPELVPELHRRAAAWHAGEGRVAAAIDHDLRAGDREAAAARIARSWKALHNSDDRPHIPVWLAELPEHEVGRVPGFVVAKAWIAGLHRAHAEMDRLVALAREVDDGAALPDGSSSTEFALALIAATFAFGDVAHARRSALHAASLARGEAHGVSLALALGCSAFWAGAPDRDARRELERAVRHGASCSPDAAAAAVALAHLAFVDLRCGELARARGHVERARWHMRRAGIEGHALACTIAIAEGWLRLVEGRTEAAVAELGYGLALARAYGEPLYVAQALGLLAECQQEEGDHHAARQTLARAHAVTRLECPDPGVLRALVESAAAQLRPRSATGTVATLDADADPDADPDAGAGDRLSERELEVLHMLGGPLSLPQIARELRVAHNTIKTHTRTIYRKLRAGGRADAVERARALRLL